ncbi:calmodulin-like [Clytia hemisphaerica]|uniref:EF-hand domain-containing protein n=1 Tax=Clytia hemisphaerica TaxID=252671 RepID=A0A7M6DR96_9CNID|eukprot:TCONS_00008652-protein
MEKDTTIQTQEADVQRYREAFRLFDIHDTGDIRLDELKEVLKNLGVEASDDDISRRLAEVDIRNNGVINFDEFVRFVSKGNTEMTPADEMRQMFRIFDPDQKGYVTKDELKVVLNKLGLPFTEQQIKGMLDYADIAGDGRINYYEFIQMMR